MTDTEAQDILITLGFDFLRKASASQRPLYLDLATREFQRYCKTRKLAKDPTPSAPADPGRLIQVDNPLPLPANARVDGRYSDPEVEKRLKLWRDNDLRCPVIIEAWTIDANGSLAEPYRSNLWLRQDVATSKDDETELNVRIFARDLSNAYVMYDPTSPLEIAGRYFGNGATGGPTTIGGTAQCKEPITFRKLTSMDPVPDPDYSDVTAKTYRVVAAVAEAEAGGFFDSLNGWDNSIISLGCYHWTLGLREATNKVTSGEIGGLFAYLKYKKEKDGDPTFDQVLGRWDLDVRLTWDSATDGSGLFNPAVKTYTTHLKESFWNASANKYDTRDIRDWERADFFRSWHWFYRFLMCTRTLSVFHNRMWDMARIRLRDLLATAWPASSGNDVIPKFENTDHTLRPATLGEVFQTELAVAMLLRWHVWAPGEVVNRTVGVSIRRAFNSACVNTKDHKGIDASLPVHKWLPCAQAILIKELSDQAPINPFPVDPPQKPRDRTSFLKTLHALEKFSCELVPAQLEHRPGFVLDLSWLPPPP